jgi:hypothetical protein
MTGTKHTGSPTGGAGAATATAPVAAPRRGKAGKASSTPAPQGAPAAQHESKAERSARQLREKETARIEQDIERREKEIKAVELELANPGVYADGARSKELVGRYEKLRAETDALWQKLGDL